jgi:glycosyltransferase involved in cell wall biosynthesis
MAKKVCFFARVKNLEDLERYEFYAQDIRILKELGFQVDVAIRPSEIRSADSYFTWWWTWAFIPIAAARAFRRPALITGTFDHWKFRARPAIHRALIRHALSQADVNIFVSKLECDQVAESLNVRRPCYIPHVVDTSIYPPGEGEREDFILTVARMDTANAARKCIPEVIQAARLVHDVFPDVRFVIAGEKGSDYPELASLVKILAADSYIDFPGPISAERKIELMQRCAVYASPSRYEGFGLAVLEAMACGAPVVSSPAGAVPEVVGDAGLLVDGTSPGAIAHAINRYLTDGSLRHEMSRKARLRAETVFPFSRRKNELGRIIEQLLEGEQLVGETVKAQVVTEY